MAGPLKKELFIAASLNYLHSYSHNLRKSNVDTLFNLSALVPIENMCVYMISVPAQVNKTKLTFFYRDPYKENKYIFKKNISSFLVFTNIVS